MKLKTTAIALAVAGSVAAPVAVQAGADEVYASARVGLFYTDKDKFGTAPAQADFQVKSFSSRFGMRGETDLGNGLTGFGRYEFGVSEAAGAGSTRHLYTGLKGGWGSVTLGQTYHTWYNFVVGPLDIPWANSGNSMIEYHGRTKDAITYAGGSGNFNFGITGYFTNDAEETAPDGVELGASFGLGDTTLALAFSQVDEKGAGIGGSGCGTQGVGADCDLTPPAGRNDEDIVGLAWHGIPIGNTSLGVSYMQQDKDKGLVADWVVGNFYIHFEQLDLDLSDAKPRTITLGYTQSLGRKTTMWYEIASNDKDDTAADDTQLMAVLKYDII